MRCKICGRKLKNEVSIYNRVGRVCALKHNIDYKTKIPIKGQKRVFDF